MPSRLVMAIAHRGASAYAPENTFAAFKKAIDIGARAIEFDVRLTGDGVPVVMHDETVDRTTNGRGLVSQLDQAYLQTLDAGSWMHPRFRDARVPTLEEAVECISAAAWPVLELKAPLDPGLLENILKRHRCLDQAVVISFDEPWLGPIKRQNRDFRIGLLAETWDPHLLPRALSLGAEVLVVSVDAMRVDLVADARTAGLEVWCYTANDMGTLAACAAMGARGIITDRPEMIRGRRSEPRPSGSGQV